MRYALVALAGTLFGFVGLPKIYSITRGTYAQLRQRRRWKKWPSTGQPPAPYSDVERSVAESLLLGVTRMCECGIVTASMDSCRHARKG